MADQLRLGRPAAQHDEIVRLRDALADNDNVRAPRIHVRRRYPRGQGQPVEVVPPQRFGDCCFARYALTAAERR